MSETIKIPDNLLPNLKFARLCKKHSDLKMLKSLVYLLGIVKKAIEYDFNIIEHKISECFSDSFEKNRLSSFIYIIYNRLEISIKNQNIEEVTKNLDYLCKIDFLTKKTRHSGLGYNTWSNFENKLIEETLNESSIITYGKTMGINIPTEEEEKRMSIAVEKALGVLNKIDNELYEETLFYLTDIVYFSSTQTTSGSSFRCLGLVSMNCINKAQNWTTALEMIIHEAAHQIVYYNIVIDNFIKNEGEGKFKSALRKDMRPMSGIFHGMVVMGRIIYVMSKLDESNILKKNDVKIIPPRNNAKNESPYHSKFFDLLEVVENNGIFTDNGWTIVEGSKKLAKNNINLNSFSKTTANKELW